MDAKRRLRVLKMTLLAIDESSTAPTGSVVDLACRYGDRFDVTAEEVREILEATLAETAGKILLGSMPNIPFYDPNIHGPLKKRPHAMRRGDRWETFTTRNQLVQLDESHELVKAWFALSDDARKAATL